MAHQGSQLQEYITAKRGRTNSLWEMLGGSRSGVYYLYQKPEIEEALQKKIAKHFKENVQTIWPEDDGIPEPPKLKKGAPLPQEYTAADLADLPDFTFSDPPTEAEIKQFMLLTMEAYKEQIVDEIVGRLKKK